MRFTILRRVGWTVVAIAALAFLQSTFRLSIGWPAAGLIAVTALTAAWRPQDALLIVVALVPVADAAQIVLGTGPDAVRYAEAIALAFIAGGAAAEAARPSPPALDAHTFWSVAGLLAVSLSSAALNLLRALVERPDLPARELITELFAREYLRRVDPFAASMRFAEGLILVLLVARACRDDRARRRTLAMLVVGGGGAALIALQRLIVAAVAQEHPWSSFVRYLTSVRVAINFSDPNAAGSFFAGVLFIALALAVGGRPAAWAGALLSATGLWIAGSRIAMAAVLLVATGAALLIGARRSRRLVAVILVSAVIVAAAGWYWYPRGRNEAAGSAWSFRIEMAAAALHMVRSAPVFGVGLGRFFERSSQYATIPENAHNNFLQIAAELGLPALALFLLILAEALRREWRRVRRDPHDWGVLAGVSAFLLTCLGGHPLLVPAAASVFWICIGVAVSAAPQPQPRRTAVRILMAVALLLIGALPFRIAAAIRDADLEHTSVGFARVWQHDPSGLRYRWAAGEATFFVTSTARTVAIPLRVPADGPSVVEVRIAIEGREANRVRLLAGGDWQTVRMLLPRRPPPKFWRIDLQALVPGQTGTIPTPVSSSAGALMVARAEVDR